MTRAACLCLVAAAAPLWAFAHHDPETVIRAIDERVSTMPATARDLTRRGDELSALARYAEAAADYRRAIQLDPAATTAHLGLCRALLEAGEHAGALAAADAALAAVGDVPGVGAVYALRAAACERVGDDDAALAAWERAISAERPEVDWLLAHASAAGRLAGPAAELRALGAALEENGSVVLRRAWIAASIRAGQAERVLPEIERKLQQSRHRSSWLLLLAEAQHAIGQPERARQSAAEAVEELRRRVSVSGGNTALEGQLTAAQGVVARLDEQPPTAR
ncbi:tetratricopeptide repeat protein [Botrimarina sp.]|uniref:tetratricopeptide repeat protein n=1 Tax=Botrimarina sp. TaxID=2795802 RepID=UPI0032EECC98